MMVDWLFLVEKRRMGKECVASLALVVAISSILAVLEGYRHKILSVTVVSSNMLVFALIIKT